MQLLDNVTVGDDFTDAATIAYVYNSKGGYAAITANDVYLQLAHGAHGLEVWTPSLHIPTGSLQLAPGTIGVRVQNYVAGKVATVSAALAGPQDPVLALGASGVSTPSAAGVSPFSITRLALGSDVTPASATDTTILSQAVTMPGTGGPFRVLANWSMLVQLGGAASVFEGWVDDQAGGNPAFADTQGFNQASTVPGGFAASAFSRNAYANAQTVNFLLRFRINSAANIVKALPFAGSHGETYLELAVFAAA